MFIYYLCELRTCDTGGTATDVSVWTAGTVRCRRSWFLRWISAASGWSYANRSLPVVSGRRKRLDSSLPSRTAGNTSAGLPGTPTSWVRQRSPPDQPYLNRTRIKHINGQYSRYVNSKSQKPWIYILFSHYLFLIKLKSFNWKCFRIVSFFAIL